MKFITTSAERRIVMGKFRRLFEPVTIGTMQVKNRFVMAPMVTNYCTGDGSVTKRLKAYHEARARGGVGLIVVEATYVHPSGKGFSNEIGIYSDDLIEGLQGLADAVHQHGAKIAVQLFHSGRQSYTTVTGAPLLAPSPIPCPVCREIPMEMSRDDIDEMIAAFASGARRAQAAGIDAIEIHGAHGYLINQFLSPYSNERTDEYGGSIENRARFPLAVLQKIKDTVGNDYPVIYRMSSVEHVPGGLTLEDTKVFSRMLVDHGIDALHVSGGVYQTAEMIIPPAAISQGLYIDNAAAIKAEIKDRVPVIAVGRLKEPAMMEHVIESGKADMIALGRALLADENLPAKLENGTPEQIRKCIACNQGCIDRLFADKDITCLGNPLVGRELEYKLDERVPFRKRVLIIGGGPGGLEAARIAALRRHNVFLYDERQKLGGTMHIASRPPFKGELAELTEFLVSEVRKMDVHIKMDHEVDDRVIERIQPDAVIMATGARPIVPDMPGVDYRNVITAERILNGAFFEGYVVVVGGGSVGCETAEFMADRGADVTVLEMMDGVAGDMGALDRALLMERMDDKGIEIITGAKVKALKGDKVVYEQAEREAQIDEINFIVLAIGYEANTGVEIILQERKIPYFKIGDCAEPRKMIEAIHEGFARAYEL